MLVFKNKEFNRGMQINDVLPVFDEKLVRASF